MLSESIRRKNLVYAVCEASPEIKEGNVFTGVVIGNYGLFPKVPEDTKVVCQGLVKEDAMEFRSEDGRYYLVVEDGWGEKDGVFYGISARYVADLGSPTDTSSIAEEYKKRGYKYGSFAGMLKFKQEQRELSEDR